jgi:two-component system response regulator CpxR
MNDSKLLIVDDDKDFALSIGQFLELYEREVDIAFTGKDGIEAAVMNDYDMILMDIGLPDLNGVESLRAIKHAKPGVRCFLMTGYSVDPIIQQGIDAGALEVLSKPIHVEELMRRLAAG